MSVGKTLMGHADHRRSATACVGHRRMANGCEAGSTSAPDTTVLQELPDAVCSQERHADIPTLGLKLPRHGNGESGEGLGKL